LMTNLKRPTARPVARTRGLQVSPQFFFHPPGSAAPRRPPSLQRTGFAGHHQVAHPQLRTLATPNSARNPKIIGQKMDVRRPSLLTVIGVMPRGFFFFPKTHSEVWDAPCLSPVPRTGRGGPRYLTVGSPRLKPGVTLEQAREDMLNVANLAGRKPGPDFQQRVERRGHAHARRRPPRAFAVRSGSCSPAVGFLLADRLRQISPTFSFIARHWPALP